jgi:hypothetical protein
VTMRLPYREELVGNPDTGAIHSGVLTVLLDHTLGTSPGYRPRQQGHPRRGQGLQGNPQGHIRGGLRLLRVA